MALEGPGKDFAVLKSVTSTSLAENPKSKTENRCNGLVLGIFIIMLN
jgi:hypothetical protein